MMGDKSRIEWLDGGASWNPITGCTQTLAEALIRANYIYIEERAAA